ncbi:MAG: hypothetical protein Q7R33_00965 [Nitrosarchaeum sp.]|nr:hypothetical protein [Nitrosarchaeum sp.]
MIKQVIVLSRSQIEYHIKQRVKPIDMPGLSWALISIYNTQELLTFENVDILKALGCQEFLSMRFADITDKEIHKDLPIHYAKNLFTENQARRIVAFVDQINKLDIDILIVHCAAGISRSGAVGVFVTRYLKLDEAIFRQTNPQVTPNLYILTTLNHVSGLYDGYEKFWETAENDRLRQRIQRIMS